jgi:hypothetical protein
MKDANFIRNGSEYDCKVAAEFMRGKWRSHSEEIRSARDFINVAATKSTTTGKPYLIRSKDGKETPSGDFLTAELKKLEAPGQ